MPWKNGGGITEEIERVPQQNDYAWRLSRAHVAADGPFSNFPGFDRWLVVIEGEGLELNAVKRLRPLDVHHFSGEEAVIGRLVNGRVWDLGLIYDRKRVAAEMKVVSGPHPLKLQGDVHYLFAAQGECEIDGHRLPPLDTIKKEGDALFRLNKGRLVMITISILDPGLR